MGRANDRRTAARQRGAGDGGQPQHPGRRPGDQGHGPEGPRAARRKAGVPGDLSGPGHAVAAGRHELQAGGQGLGDLEMRRARDAGVADAHRVGEPITARRRGSAVGDADGQRGSPQRRNRRCGHDTEDLIALPDDSHCYRLGTVLRGIYFNSEGLHFYGSRKSCSTVECRYMSHGIKLETCLAG